MTLPPSGMVPSGRDGPEDGRSITRGYGHLRSSAADREGVVEVLKAAFTEGRLDQEELADRVGCAYRSRTYAQLAALIFDLPAGQPGSGLPAVQPAFDMPARQPIHDQRAGRCLPGSMPAPAGAGIVAPPPSIRAIPVARTGRQLSGLAIASSILGVGGFVTMGITSPFALIAGIAATPRLALGSERGGAYVFLGVLLGLIGTLFILLPELLMGRLLP